MLKSGEGSREYEIKDADMTVRKVAEEMELEKRNCLLYTSPSPRD